MCGICGIFYPDRLHSVDERVLRSMNGRIAHRGPDDEGFYVRANVGLAMRRLSIIDISTGHQPVANEDNTVWIVFNGEIYNYRDVRQGLEERGHRFRTHSDTETIIHLYEEYGRECVKHLRGMFAFVIWDEKKRVLFGARDRLGIKPFYYLHTPELFLFGSEIKTLLEHPSVKAEFNPAVLSEYLAFGYTAGNDTFFRGVKKLPPGHWVELDELGRFEVQQYWDLEVPAATESRPETYWVDSYRDMLESCVQSHLMSDVPLGMFLSGGLDSSAVAALATKLRGGPIQTFAVGYNELAFSELPYAQAVARHLNSVHHEVRIGPDEFFGALPALVWHEDEPISWQSSVSLYFVAKLARQHVTVVLTGEGSDETLAGYARYAWTLLNTRLQRGYRLVPGALRRLVRNLTGWHLLGGELSRKLQHTVVGRDGESWADLYLDNYLCAFSARDQAQLLADGVGGDPYANTLTYWKRARGNDLQRLLYTDIKTYLVELLMKQDQMSMAASIESRVPFLDHALVEFAMTVPSELKVRGMAGKHLLKAAMRGLLPDEIIDRKKMGFPTPWKAWLQGEQLSRVEAMLTEGPAAGRRLFRLDAVRRLIREHRARHVDHSERLWRLVNVEVWHRVFMDRDSSAVRDAGKMIGQTVEASR